LDIKLKKSKALIVWLCFFIGICIVAGIITGGIVLLKEDYHGFLYALDKAFFKLDIKDTLEFKHTISLRFHMLAEALTDENAEERLKEVQSNLEKEGQNLIYYAKNLQNGVKLSNSETDFGAAAKGFPNLPDGYDYYIFFYGKKMTIEDSGKAVNIYDKNVYNAGYSVLKHYGYLSEDIALVNPILSKCHILLIVKKDIEEVDGQESQLYQIKQDLNDLKSFFGRIFIVFLIGWVLIFLSILNRVTKKEFDVKIGNFLGKFWIEIKIIAALIILFIVVLISYRYDSIGISMLQLLAKIFTVLIVIWSLYFVFIDLLHNRKKVFYNNTINSLIKVYRTFERKKPFQKGMLLRLYVFIAAEAILVITAGISFIILAFGNTNKIPFLFGFLLSLAIGVYLIYRYVRRYNNTVSDIGKLIDQIEAIKNGDVKNKLQLNPDADMYNAAQSLNKIQEGINKAVEARIRSERTKVELITNVSHDLKTPLTSIISYVDLLYKEEGLSEHIKDYIKIIKQKSDRLKTLIADLFDLTKATSGEINVDFEKIDLGKLVWQTLADMNDDIEQSGLKFKVNIPESPLFIMSDGKKLYRVFQNLISNALKYSLAGSRVYVDLTAGNGKGNAGNGKDNDGKDNTAMKDNIYREENVDMENNINGFDDPWQVTAIIKNIANYEMNFTEDEILERFARGDKARSTEGSGLGLAIAKSFTQVCGGEFDIVIDGDMFKAILKFNLIGENA